MVGGTNTNLIRILIEYVTKGAAKANAVARKTNEAIDAQRQKYVDANKETKRGIDATRNNMIANSKAGQVMRMNQEVLGKYNKEGRGFNTLGGRMANRFRMITHGARGFRMEMLGVMFFGMALQRVFSGLIKTSLDWFGVTELLSMTLGLLFLPVGELVLGWALRFLDWVLQLTDTEKKIIGWFVLVGIAVGTLTFLIGTLALGIGSMILAFNFSSIATIIGSSGLGGISTAATTAATKVATLQSILGKAILVAVGITIAWAGFTFIRSGIEQGSLLKEIMGVLTMGIGLGIVGLALGGVAGGLIGFTLGVSIGLMISWFIKSNKGIESVADRTRSQLEAAGASERYIQEQVKKVRGPGFFGIDFGKLLGTAGGQPKDVSDFILQPGGKLIKTDPSDTIMGSKSGFGGSNISVTYNITGVSSPQDIRNMLEENNRTLTADVARMVGG